MKRLLIVSPHFPPTNAADHQRVRLLLPYLREFGWEAHVLAVSPAQVASPCDNWLEETLAAEVPVHRIKALGLSWAHVPGLGSLGLRSLLPLRLAGNKLLSRTKFDLIYFSTTVFPVHLLGPTWTHRFAVPFAMDYQDPWVNDYYRQHPQVIPPGGRSKYAIMDRINRWSEPRVLRKCTGITAVSMAYPEQLRRRYGFASRLPACVIPFPGDVRDFDQLHLAPTGKLPFDSNDGRSHWVYVGRGGPDMALAIRALLLALRNHGAANQVFLDKLRLHFIGTSYAPKGRGLPTLAPLAAEFGLAHIASECPDRIPYADALRCLLSADALVVPGSDDPAYTASKVYPYLLARKPLLTIFHRNSSVNDLVSRVGGAVAVNFETGDSVDSIASRISARWLNTKQFERPVPLDDREFEPYTARASARKLTEFFQAILSALQ